MSNEELVASLGVELDAGDVADLKEYLDAAEEAQALDAEDGEALKSNTKLAVAAAAGHIIAKFQPGPHGKGPCPKKGAGAYVGPQPPTPIVPGKYILKIRRFTAKLYRDGRLIWSGYGAEKGITGDWPIQF